MMNHQMVSSMSQLETIGLCFYVGVTMAVVHKELAEEELAEAKQGNIELHEVSRSTFLRVGFELEEQQ
jgi:hypothetical protein